MAKGLLRNTAIFIISAAVVGYFVYTYQKMQHTEVPSSYPNTHSWSKQITIRQFDSNGKLKSKIAADRMISVSATKQQVEHDIWYNPRIDTTDSKGLKWYITAKHGISYGKNKIILQHNVYMHRFANKKIPNKPDTIITSESITMYPNKSIAKTNKFAKIVQPQQTITGIGMIANFKTSKARILKQSHAIFHNLGD